MPFIYAKAAVLTFHFHFQEIVESRIQQLECRSVQYCYKAGNPVIFDARTMHGVENNVSDTWRVVCWFIIDCY